MKVIALEYPVDDDKIPAGSCVLAMGFFDGVHRGHQAVILRAKQIAQKKHLPLAVLTYNQSPAIVFHQFPNGVHYLSSLDRKIDLMRQLGVERLYVMAFTSHLAQLAPQDFIDEVIMKLHPAVTVAGFDHTYGPKDAGMAQLPQYAQGRFQIVVVDKHTDGSNDKIASTKIRQLLDEGQVDQANHLLGYRYATDGTVVHGLARGRTLGFPTANVAWQIDQRIPAVGVYAVQFLVNHHWYNGMASVGYNETFGEHNRKTIEVYLFNFNDYIYGERVTVRWVKEIRGQVKFNSAQKLVDQLKDDQRVCEQLLSDIKELPGQLLH
ncbi:riboflavin biosynthesis protein RibF [Limosilactobacillus secaliphilus]|uniref:Riboflavin biosynthesis protein n=1 Tax=Limosilactobacillus secaliphilus TaxID=396268 RepID=A0A0R2I0T7_9LACO|nr:riboflavin biosynthesis protein RibF [Limosilactobacillus secaliphilus]KRN58767.1 putative FAD synthetase [Limosilactobacillus secaliphilus]